MAQPIHAQPLDLASSARPPALLRIFDRARSARLEAIGCGVLRYGLVALLGIFGAMKFTELEAQGIRPLVEHHPLLGLSYQWFGVRGGSAIIGVIELTAAAAMALRRVRPLLSAAGSLLAVVTFLMTLSFLITTPNVLAPENPFGGFLMKDIVLLGAALHTAAEALGAARRAAALRAPS